MPNKWLNPPLKEIATNDLSDQFFAAIGKGISFLTIKEQVGKKTISTKSKGDRVSAKSWKLTY